MIGPGKAFDTDRYFVICSNVLGGCQGTTGPGSINPATGKPYAMAFPVITIRDMVRLQRMLIGASRAFPRLLCVAGGSMGGMQALEWAVSYPGDGLFDHPDRDHMAAQRAADRVQRSGPAGDHGRSRLGRRRVLREETARRAGCRWLAWWGTSRI